MRTLTVRQPWAFLIIHGGKNVENRTWAADYLGPLLIHASKGMTRKEFDECCRFCESRGLAVPTRADLQFGGIVGKVEVVGYTMKPDVSPWFMGPIGWLVKNPVALPFVACNGRLGLWEHELAQEAK